MEWLTLGRCRIYALLCLALLLGSVSSAAALLPDNTDLARHVSGTSWYAKHHNENKPVGPHDKIEWTPRTIGALIITCACALLANGAGIGGGPIYLPTLMVIVGFELTPATALSHTIVSISAIASSIYGLCARNPNAPERSLIDWDLAIFIPALLVGVSVGVLFNVIFPRWIQTILLTILLIAVFVKTLGKGRKMWASERKNAELKQRELENENHAPDEHTDDEEEGILHDESYHVKPHKQEDLRRSQENGVQSSVSRIQDAVAEGSKIAKSGVRGCLGRQPYFKIIGVVILWVIFLVFQQSKSRYNRCTGPYIGLFIAEVVLFAGFAIAGVLAIAWQADKHPDDVDPELRDALLGNSSGVESGKKTMKKLLLVSGVMAASGLLAGLLGIGDKP